VTPRPELIYPWGVWYNGGVKRDKLAERRNIEIRR
jgi:hypothetical protein